MRILIVSGDAGESLEIFYPKFRLEEEGWYVAIAAPEKRMFQSVVHDFEPGFDTYTEKRGYRVQADLALNEVDPTTFDALVLPGGRAPEYLRNNPDAIKIVQHFIELKKPIATNCHGPLLLFAAGLESGRCMTAYPDLAIDVVQSKTQYKNEPVVVDGNLVSVRGWPDNSSWMREFVKLLKK
jgi:protease I